MIAVQIYYPRIEGGDIDVERYIVHMKMACRACGDAIKGCYVLKEIPGAGYNALAGEPFPTHVCVGVLLFESYEDFEKKFKPIVAPLRADTAIFSTIKPYTSIFTFTQNFRRSRTKPISSSTISSTFLSVPK